jgi:lysozyme
LAAFLLGATTMHMSAQGRAFLTVQEGLREHAYKDAVGVWTIGVGHTSEAGMPHVTPGMTITHAQADEILARDLVKFEGQVSAEVRVALAQCQFDALVSFTYNLGEGSLRRLVAESDLNSGDYSKVATHILVYDRAGGRVLPDLVRRRKAEAAMFASGKY